MFIHQRKRPNASNKSEMREEPVQRALLEYKIRFSRSGRLFFAPSRDVATRRDATQASRGRDVPFSSVMDGPYNGRTRRASPVKGFLLKDLSACPCLDIATRRPRDDHLTNELSVTNKSKASSRTSLCLTTRRDRKMLFPRLVGSIKTIRHA